MVVNILFWVEFFYIYKKTNTNTWFEHTYLYKDCTIFFLNLQHFSLPVACAVRSGKTRKCAHSLLPPFYSCTKQVENKSRTL